MKQLGVVGRAQASHRIPASGSYESGRNCVEVCRIDPTVNTATTLGARRYVVEDLSVGILNSSRAQVVEKKGCHALLTSTGLTKPMVLFPIESRAPLILVRMAATRGAAALVPS